MTAPSTTPFHHDPWLTIHGGDCRDVLATMADESVHAVVTSPPYWNLRDYGIEGQLGLEPTPDEYVANMVAVFREVRRVLRSDGTCWLNLGDTFMSSGGERAYGSSDGGTGRGAGTRRNRAPAGLKPKDLVGIPWRVAFALQADGWYLRSDVIWSKPNPMPEPVTDRPTKAHEYLFLLTKSARYWYDADAIKEEGSGEVWDSAKGFSASGKRGEAGHSFFTGEATHRTGPQTGRNRRSVWTVATQPYPGAHFAVMPEALVEPCVLAGCPDKACGECGAPWERVVEREVGTDGRKNLGDRERNRGGRTDGLTKLPDGYRVTTTTTGWRPTCAHADAPTVPGVTLDPFGGSGTVARVANRLSRRAVLVDLNPEYLRQQLRRANALPMGL